jgi:ribosomal protein S18 acetylase RimI-like enzyme
VTIRPATVADIPALHALIERTYRGDTAKAGWTHEADMIGGQRTDPEQLAEMIADPRQLILIADAEGQPHGCVSLTDKGEGLAYLGLLTVDPMLQAAGLGRAMLAEAERESAARFGATRMEMSVIAQRPELVAWYERRGYAQTGERRPFPYGDERFGRPEIDTLEFVVMERAIG